MGRRGFGSGAVGGGPCDDVPGTKVEGGGGRAGGWVEIEAERAIPVAGGGRGGGAFP